MDQNVKYRASGAPHVRGGLTAGSVMADVLIALIPALIWGLGRFGTHALLVVLTAVLTGALLDFAFNTLTGRSACLLDGAGAVTGLLLALTLPGDVPLYIPFAGAAAAVILIKGLGGGRGRNLLNPALGARCLLTMAFREQMTGLMDGVAAGTGADALRVLIGSRGAMIGGCAVALLIGGLYLLCVRRISWRIPCAVLASYLVFGLALNGCESVALGLGGGVVMAAFFLACDPVTSPVTPNGQLIFGCLAGLLCALFGKIAEPALAVSLAVLAANVFVPLIERRTVPKPR